MLFLIFTFVSFILQIAPVFSFRFFVLLLFYQFVCVVTIFFCVSAADKRNNIIVMSFRSSKCFDFVCVFFLLSGNRPNRFFLSLHYFFVAVFSFQSSLISTDATIQILTLLMFVCVWCSRVVICNIVLFGCIVLP